MIILFDLKLFVVLKKYVFPHKKLVIENCQVLNRKGNFSGKSRHPFGF